MKIKPTVGSSFVDNVLDKTYIRSADMDARRTDTAATGLNGCVAIPKTLREFTYNFNR